MAPNPLFVIPDFFCIYFPNVLCYGYLSFEGNWNFLISFKPKVAIAKYVWKMQRKIWYSILGLDAMALSLKKLLVKECVFCHTINIRFDVKVAENFLHDL